MNRLMLMTCTALVAFAAVGADTVDGGRWTFGEAPKEVVVSNGVTTVFTFTENGTTGFLWYLEGADTNACTIVLDHRGAPEPKPGEPVLCGAGGQVTVTVTPKASAASAAKLGELQYKRCWERDVAPFRTVVIRAAPKSNS